MTPCTIVFGPPQSGTCRLVFVLLLGFHLLIGSACRHSPVQPNDRAITPAISEIAIHANENSVLSAIVTAKVENVEKVAVEFGELKSDENQTPFFPVTETFVEIPVLGLAEETSYRMRVLAISTGGSVVMSEEHTFATGVLPSDIPRVSVLKRGSPSDGYVMLGYTSPGSAAAFYALMLNNAGEIVWYRQFPRAVVDFQKQPNGLYTAYTSLDQTPLRFFEFDKLGVIRRQFQAGDGFSTGPHEFRIVDQSYFLFAVEHRNMDLTSLGGLPDAQVRGTAVQFHRGNGDLFTWSPFDHLAVSDAAPDVALDSRDVNPWHGNAIDLDTDGNLLISFRNSDEIIKVDSKTGQIIWRLGGKNNEFTFLNDALGRFSHQHGIRRLRNGHIILFDNGNLHDPPVSRAVEYRLDEVNKIAELVWEFRHEPALFGFALGFAQRLPNGNTLINYGTAQRIIEVDASRAVQWDISVIDPDRFPYRAFRIDSLY